MTWGPGQQTLESMDDAVASHMPDPRRPPPRSRRMSCGTGNPACPAESTGGSQCRLEHNKDQTVHPGTNQASEGLSMNSALAVVKEVSVQDVVQGPYLLRVGDRLAAETVEVPAASGQ